ncbi:SYP112 protein [Hibiscus syriacus]|uniref:SYP112 protein n=1 Tax=Hibiscus syriacus TaxID=106335 RepID=A0A6A3A110_HIBSY|nr:SYP112 protein [Hibiscus syriacus]
MASGKGNSTPPMKSNLSLFFQEVASIKITMDEITNLVFDLQSLNEETKSTNSTKVLGGLRDRMESDTVSILRKAKFVKQKLEPLDRSNASSRRSSGSYVDRTRISVTNGLRAKLKQMMNDFQPNCGKRFCRIIKKISREDTTMSRESSPKKPCSKRQFHRSFCEKAEIDSRNNERHEAVLDIQRSLQRLHQVFHDMAVLVEAQGEKMDDIEENVANAGSFINGGTNNLRYANQMKRK